MRTIFNRHLLVGFSALALLVPSAVMASKTVPTSGGPVGPDPPSICDAIAGNLVSNCGFETGDFTDWTQSGNTGATGVTSGPFDGFVANSGNFFAALGPVLTDGFLSQTLATTAGNAYQLQYYLGSDGDTPNDFDAEIGALTLYNATDIPSTSGTYTLFTFDFVATGPTLLTFSFRNDPGYLALDDISVRPAITVIPEPGTFVLWSLALVSFIAVTWWKRRGSSGTNLRLIS